MTLWRKLLDGWKAIAGHFGSVQTLVLLAFFYAVLIGPVSVAIAIGRSDPLDRRSLGSSGSAWRDADTAGADLERAKRIS
ncbi:MAG: hypothetical protein OEM05_12810 [Myxococcales bacterium]|nr:hypothetical protein [Myxococcales bacterium]